MQNHSTTFMVEHKTTIRKGPSRTFHQWNTNSDWYVLLGDGHQPATEPKP